MLMNVLLRRREIAHHLDDSHAWARKDLAGHKYPRVVEFRGEPPMTSTDKILKREPRS